MLRTAVANQDYKFSVVRVLLGGGYIESRVTAPNLVDSKLIHPPWRTKMLKKAKAVSYVPSVFTVSLIVELEWSSVSNGPISTSHFEII